MKKFFQSIGSKLKSLNEKYHASSFYARFRGLNTLVAMQLKDKLNFSFKADKKGALTKLLIRFILFAVVTAAIAVLFYLLTALQVFGALATSFPVPIFNFIFIVMILLSTLSCISSLTKSLYFSKDNLTLLSYPVRSNTVFLSKLIVYYISSLIREIAFILPLFLAYGIASGFPFYYYFWAIFMYFIICAVPVAIASIVSIPWMFVSLYFRKHPLAQDIVLVLVLIVASVFLFIAIDMIPADLHFLVQWTSKYYPMALDFCKNFQVWLFPFYVLSSLVIGCKLDTTFARGLTVFSEYTGLYFVCVVGAIIILIGLAYLTAKPLFFKMAAKPFEFNKKIIFHNYSVSKQKVRSTYYQYAFVPTIFKEKKVSTKDKIDMRLKFEKALSIMNRDEIIFEKGISDSRILKLLKRYTKQQFEIVSIQEFVDNGSVGFAIENRLGIPSLVLAKSVGISYIDCFDPNYLNKVNHVKSSFFSMMWKDFLLAIRTPGTLMLDYLLMIIGPLSVALMNKLFQSVNTSFMGDQYVVMFNILIIIMVPLVSNISIASIYSREGESSYLLKASPANYTKTLTSKLVLRWIMVAVALIATIVVYDHYCNVFFNKPTLLYFTILAIYTGHLIWSAELDYMNPQDQLYKEVGEGNIANNNETISGILAFVITALFTLVSLLLLNENVAYVFYKLFLIAGIFLACRIILAVCKIRGYKTSRGERGRD